MQPNLSANSFSIEVDLADGNTALQRGGTDTEYDTFYPIIKCSVVKLYQLRKKKTELCGLFLEPPIRFQAKQFLLTPIAVHPR